MYPGNRLPNIYNEKLLAQRKRMETAEKNKRRRKARERLFAAGLAGSLGLGAVGGNEIAKMTTEPELIKPIEIIHRPDLPKLAPEKIVSLLNSLYVSTNFDESWQKISPTHKAEILQFVFDQQDNLKNNEVVAKGFKAEFKAFREQDADNHVLSEPMMLYAKRDTFKVLNEYVDGNEEKIDPETLTFNDLELLDIATQNLLSFYKNPNIDPEQKKYTLKQIRLTVEYLFAFSVSKFEFDEDTWIPKRPQAFWDTEIVKARKIMGLIADNVTAKELEEKPENKPLFE